MSFSNLSALEILESSGCRGKTEKKAMLVYLVIFENQTLCLDTDENWHCSCGTMDPEKKCHICSFIIKFRDLHEKVAQHYLRDQVEEFYIVFKEILPLQENALKLEPMLQEILTKEYQFKNSYQGKYCDPNNIYGP